MSAEQNVILLNEGQALDVELVAGADEFLTQLLGGASAKAGLATLKPVKNSAGVPFVAAIIGGKHVGFLPQGVAADIFPILAGCEEQGMVPRAKARVAAPVEGQARPLLTVSLAEPDRLISFPQPEAAPALSPAIVPNTAPVVAAVTSASPAGETAVAAEPQSPSEDASADEAETAAPLATEPAEELPPDAPPVGAYQEGWRVEGDTIISPSPLVLPEGCVGCGDPVVGGRRFNRTLYYCAPWVWLTILIGLLPFIIVYLVVRKPLALSYAQCNACAGRQDLKKWIAVGVWILLLAMIVVSIWSQSTIAIAVMAVLFVGALVATVIAGPPLRVTGHSLGYFTVKGASRRFLSNLSGVGDLTAAVSRRPPA
jgi:hypothetical protein